MVNQLAEAAALEAKIILYGILDFNTDILPLFPILSKGISISGFHLGFHLLNMPDRAKEMQKYLLESLDKGHYFPKTDKVFPFSETKEAYQYLESNQQKGKIVVRFGN
ncbi:MAG: zinc-binding dehydrogenase [Bacteroidia bacterium]|nr:zinc-binding dehydrogenase [Bacteroidia bacterium]